MKTCPYCAESIRKEAIKCRFCGSMLDKKDFNLNFFSTPGYWHRVNKGKKVAGVCTGVAKQLDSPILILPLRLFFILTTIFYGFGFILYIMLWVLMPAPKDKMAGGDSFTGTGRKSAHEDKPPAPVPVVPDNDITDVAVAVSGQDTTAAEPEISVTDETGSSPGGDDTGQPEATDADVSEEPGESDEPEEKDDSEDDDPSGEVEITEDSVENEQERSSEEGASAKENPADGWKAEMVMKPGIIVTTGVMLLLSLVAYSVMLSVIWGISLPVLKAVLVTAIAALPVVITYLLSGHHNVRPALLDV